MNRLAIVALLLLAACSHGPNRRTRTALAEVQARADYELGCQAALTIVQDFKKTPITVGAECGGQKALYTRAFRTIVWQRH